MSESQVVKACIKWLFDPGRCFVWRNNSGAYKPDKGGFIRYGYKGSSDIIGVTQSGRFIAVECKFGKNDLQDSQEAFKARIESKNGIFITAWSVDDLEARKAEILA